MPGLKMCLLLSIMAASMRTGLAYAGIDAEAKDVAGYYEGTANSKQAGSLQVSLNLRLVKGRYEGALVTPVGNFSLKAASFSDAKLKLQFDANGSAASFDGRLEGEVLSGTFEFGDDSGSMSLRRMGSPKAPLSTEPILRLSKRQWQEDLHCMARELAQRHANAFHHVSRERFNAAVAELEQRLERMNSDAIYVGLNRIANLIGDGHTYVDFPPDTANLPLNIKRFGDDYRVDAVAAGQEKALGTRVLKVQDLPIARARELLLTMTPQDETPVLAQARVENFLTMGIVLHGYGIIRDRNSARFTFADDSNQEFSMEFHALAPDAEVRWVQPYKEPPLFRQKSREPFWHTDLPEARTVYCNFRSYKELAKHAHGLLTLLDRQHPDKLVIDLRQNGGGDYLEGLKYLIEPIRQRPDINRKGHLFVLIGPQTFSAAMSNAAQFRAKTAALLVGEPIGEKPNSYQEARQMNLPNSHLLVRYSTRFYRFIEDGENMIRPNQEIVPSWSDFKAGRDPVLEWVKKYERH
jgi:Peptidase family S41